MDIKLIIATHKNVEFPNDPIYIPVQVNAEKNSNHFCSTLDNQGNNISLKNESYCELTALYEAIYNMDYDVIGLVHYRRYFANSNLISRKSLNNVIKKEMIEKLLNKYDIILPKKRHYYIETNYSHYIHAHKKEALDEVRNVIKDKYPEYLNSFDKVMKRRSGHYFNMFIAKKELAKAYCDWMFDILFELENKIDLSNYTDQERRVFGFVSELLMDVYVDKNKLKVKNQKYFFMEKQNWFKKIFNFIKRKFNKN